MMNKKMKGGRRIVYKGNIPNKSMKEKIIPGILMVFVVVSMFSLIKAEVNMSNPLEYQRYQLVLNEFNNSEWVSIKVRVFSEEVREDVISSLPEDEFKLQSKSLLGLSFSGEITKQGLDKLVNNSNVRGVNLGGGSASPFEDDKSQANYNWLYWLGGIILILIIIWGVFKIKRR